MKENYSMMERQAINSGKKPSEESFGDPRIESPVIKVVYPVVDRLKKSKSMNESENSESDSTQTVSEVTQTVAPNEAVHECVIGLQDAIKQHLYPLLGGALLFLVIGYLIGKK